MKYLRYAAKCVLLNLVLYCMGTTMKGTLFQDVFHIVSANFLQSEPSVLIVPVVV